MWKLFRYLEPFWRGSRVWQTDGRTVGRTDRWPLAIVLSCAKSEVAILWSCYDSTIVVLIGSTGQTKNTQDWLHQTLDRTINSYTNKSCMEQTPHPIKLDGELMCQMVNNSVADCSISIKFTTDYDHVTPDLPQTFKVNGSKVKITAYHDVLA